MAQCAACGSRIFLGGIRTKQGLFCGIRCWLKGVPQPPLLPLPVGPLSIGNPIGNEAVNGYVRANMAEGECLIGILPGIGEEKRGALFQKFSTALGGVGTYLVVTDRKIVAIKSGLGIITKTYFYDAITSVNVNKNLIFGEIEILTAGMVEKSPGNIFSNSLIQFDKKYFEEVSRLAEKIRNLVAQARQSLQSQAIVVADRPDQIRKLAELRDTGILTEEEFQSKKQTLLGKL